MTAPNVDSAEGGNIIYPSAIPFALVHLACIGAIWTGVTWQALTICVGLYWLRIFAIGGGYWPVSGLRRRKVSNENILQSG